MSSTALHKCPAVTTKYVITNHNTFLQFPLNPKPHSSHSDGLANSLPPPPPPTYTHLLPVGLTDRQV